jgi:hypothetical protein
MVEDEDFGCTGAGLGVSQCIWGGGWFTRTHL